MVEIIDKSTGQKMMMMTLCGICYRNDCYLIYCIRRDKEEANIFVSKLLKGSMGYLLCNNFENGEKEVIDQLVKRILNKDRRELLERDGFTILDRVDLDSSLEFDIEACYVATTSRSLIKECLLYYNLISEEKLQQPTVEVTVDNRKFNEGFVSSIVLIIFGITILIFSIVVIYGVLVK